MMHPAISREELFEMAAEPIGNAALMVEASDPAILRGAKKPSLELKEAAARAKKIWLPGGKKSTVSLESKAAEQAFYLRQVDLEDAVEAAGGRRGGRYAPD